ncbi:purple acid phosphatase 7-like isoform X1 [Papaver somniferum]|nr:purple acid phosphatase 7-like isoform X1 [Papaver somniferum]
MVRIIRQSLSACRSLLRSTMKSFKGDTLMSTKSASQVPNKFDENQNVKSDTEIQKMIIGDAHQPSSTTISQAILRPQRDYVSSSYGELQRFKHPMKEDGSLSFLVVGDWGRRGSYNQCHVAHQMGRIGEKLDIDFVISTGDNFYTDGLKAVDDPAFQESFVNIYTAPSLQKQWYNVLGNHDYRGDVEAQLSPLLRQRDSRWFCLRSYVLDAEIVDFIFVDTTPFVEKYFTEPKEHTYDWRGVIPRRKYITKHLEEVDIALKETDARWKIVVGHHTLRSAGHHRDTEELAEQLIPILEENKVDLYVNGHDHCLQHITCTKRGERIEFVTSGGGSKAWKNDFIEEKEGLNFYHDGQGFVSMGLTQTVAKIVFYDVFGQVVHHFNMYKEQQLHSFG